MNPAQVKVPSLDYEPDPRHAEGFDKYYHFHRADTTFTDALADLRDCDGMARGLSRGQTNYQPVYTYASPMAGAVGGLIGSLLVDAIAGSATVRTNRRINMRRCMHYKGYQRYGLPKDIWTKFNFEEGFTGVSEEDRKTYLMQQAKIASSEKPGMEALGK